MSREEKSGHYDIPMSSTSTSSIPISIPPQRPLITQFTNVRLIRDHMLLQDDLWMCQGKIINPQSRFWDAVTHHEYAADIIINGHGYILAPGYIDIQLNGGYGYDFSTPQHVVQQDGVSIVAHHLLRQGVTSFLPTIITSSPETYRTILPHLGPRKGNAHAAHVLGAHAEGPFISVLGAHPQSLTRIPTSGLSDLISTYGDLSNIRIITIAPELKGAMEAIKQIRTLHKHTSNGINGTHSTSPSTSSSSSDTSSTSTSSTPPIIISAGHSACSLAQSQAAVDAGVTLITHLFNAMVPFHHRDPGLIGLLGTTNHQVYYGLIVDGIHTHPASVKIAYCAHPKGVVLVTDAMAAMGLPCGQYSLGTLSVDVRPDGSARLTGSDTLAGSIATLDDCVKKFHAFTGCTIVEAIDAATQHPAQVLGLSGIKGCLSYGADADLILVSDTLDVLACWVDGECAWHHETAITIHHNTKSDGTPSIPITTTTSTTPFKPILNHAFSDDPSMLT